MAEFGTGIPKSITRWATGMWEKVFPMADGQTGAVIGGAVLVDDTGKEKGTFANPVVMQVSGSIAEEQTLLNAITETVAAAGASTGTILGGTFTSVRLEITASASNAISASEVDFYEVSPAGNAYPIIGTKVGSDGSITEAVKTTTGHNGEAWRFQTSAGWGIQAVIPQNGITSITGTDSMTVAGTMGVY